MAIRNIIFDFDGTLADTAKGIIATEREVLRTLGLPQQTDAQICSAIGLPLAQSLSRGALIPDGLLDEAVVLYRKFFNELAPKHIVIFDGVKDTLEYFRAQGIRLAIATSRSSNSLSMILNTHGIAGFFETMLAADAGIRPKPAPDMVLTLLERMGIDAADTLVVGDTTFDLEMGAGAGCRTAGVTYGNHSREQLLSVSPDWIIDGFDELKDIVSNN